MHNKPYKVDASKITRVLPGFTYIPLDASVRAAADSVVALGLAAPKPTLCCTAPQVKQPETTDLATVAGDMVDNSNINRHHVVAEILGDSSGVSSIKTA